MSGEESMFPAHARQDWQDKITLVEFPSLWGEFTLSWGTFLCPGSQFEAFSSGKTRVQRMKSVNST